MSRLSLSLLIFKAGELISEKRLKRGLSYEKLSDLSGVSKEDILKVESGKVPEQDIEEDTLLDWTVPLRLIVALEDEEDKCG